MARSKQKSTGGRPKGSKNCAYRTGDQACHRWAVQNGLCADHAALISQALKTIEEPVDMEPVPQEETLGEMMETETPAVKSEYKPPKSQADLAKEAIEAREAEFAAIDFDAELVVRKRKVSAGPDPETLAAALVAQRIASEQKQKRAMHDDVPRYSERDGKGLEGFRKDPPRVPLKVQRANYFDDMPEDSDLTDLPEDVKINPGWVPRWVRPTDRFGKPSNARVSEFKKYGYEVVRRENGEVCREDVGVLMQGPPDAYAKRVYKYTNKHGLDPSKMMDHYHEIVEKHNREVGEEVFQLHVGKEHGTTRRESAGMTDDD